MAMVKSLYSKGVYLTYPFIPQINLFQKEENETTYDKITKCDRI